MTPSRRHAFLGQAFFCLLVAAASPPTVTDTKQNVTYHGLAVNAVEKFLNIPYGQDTSGQNRFANPEPYVFSRNISAYDASKNGPVCPQDTGAGLPYESPVPLSTQSEDCLKLKVARPRGVKKGDGLPVMVWIYGGGLFDGSINEAVYEPDSLIAQSVENGMPVIYVAMNYRLNIFGFALTEPLRANKSLNVGLKDQRLALEWVQDNIEYFGGDPNRVTIFGQSSGGLSVGLQILAYGGSKPVPFQGAIMESTALEPTSTSNFSIDSYNAVANLTGCVHGDGPQSSETLACLRSLSFDKLLNITIEQHDSTATSNDGDVYLPAVDDDFLPLASSELAQQGMFAKLPIIIGWANNDGTLFTNNSIKTSQDTHDFVHLYWAGLSEKSISTILSLYPSSAFAPNPSANLSAEFYRTAEIFRDILFVCPSFLLGSAMATKYQDQTPPVYYYEQNQTILASLLEKYISPGLGVIHISELAYVFANFTSYNTTGDIHPSPSDLELLKQESRSWSTFASTFNPSLDGKETLKGWTPAYDHGSQGMFDAKLMVIGGSEAGISTLDGVGASEAVAKQELRDRCGFLNQPEVIKQLQY